MYTYRNGFSIKFCEDEITPFKVIIQIENGTEIVQGKKRTVYPKAQYYLYPIILPAVWFIVTCSPCVCMQVALWHIHLALISAGSCPHV